MLKRKIMQALAYGPKGLKQLRKETGAPIKSIRKELKSLLKHKKVKIVATKYQLVETAQEFTSQAIPAKIVKLGRSFGFATPLDGSEDIFVPGRALKGAMPGDEVNITLFEKPRVAGSREGAVTSYIMPKDTVVGTLQMIEGHKMLVPDRAPENPLFIAKGMAGDAKIGEKVAAEFVVRGERHTEHRVRLVLRFGSSEIAKECAAAILYEAGIAPEFPVEVENAARSFVDRRVTKDETANRKDLRGESVFTIDSASTKDMDDAISIKSTEKGYLLGVHIADVSYYVQPKTELDEEALQRGTSVYYADSVVPMLPKELSNGICSLNPQEDRLAFSCFLELGHDGEMLDFSFEKTVICSQLKGVYSEINTIFKETATKEILEKYNAVLPDLQLMYELYQKLAKRRAVRGSLEIESEEAYLVVDENGRCVDVQKRTRGDAERLIEEFMLLANSAAASLARTINIPFVYRVHESPSAEKIEQLKAALVATGVQAKFVGAIPTQVELAALLNETRGTAIERFVHTNVLRSMAKAKYEPIPKGHYGLALDDYAHFTSPIRRYPDLAIHRILSDAAAKSSVKELNQRYTRFAEQASLISSERELTAQRAERDCDDCYKAEYMQQFIGDEFEGVVSSVTQFGIYIELPNTVEGLIHVTELSALPMELVDNVRLVDVLTGKSYHIGDKLRVRLVKVNVAQGNIDFALAQDEAK